jgi:hypothetical protein
MYCAVALGERRDKTGAVFNTRVKTLTQKYQVQNPRNEKLALPQTLALLKHTLAKKTPVSLCNSIKTHSLKTLGPSYYC